MLETQPTPFAPIKVQAELKLNPELVNIEAFKNYKDLPVETAFQCTQASQHLVIINLRLKAIEKDREPVEVPLKQALSAFRTMARRVIDPLETIEKILKFKISKYWTAQQERKDAEEKKRRDKEAEDRRAIAADQQKLAMTTGSQKAADIAVRNEQRADKLETEPVKVSQSEQVSGGGVIQITRWKWRIENATQVPRDYLVINEKKLNFLARQYNNNAVEVPGVTFEKIITTGVRSN